MDSLGVIEPHVDSVHPDSEISEAIRIARVVCIFFMIFVHVNPGTAGFLPDETGVRVFDVLRFFVVDSLGRASVALLSVVAGYLAVHSLRRERFSVFVRKKVRSLLVPLVLWNVLFIVLVYLGDHVSGGYMEEALRGELSLGRLPELILNVKGTAANEPLAFLRDVFVCSLLTPVILFALRWGNRQFVVVSVALTALGALTPLLMTPSILALYCCGIFFAVHKRVPMPDRNLAFAALAAFFVLGALITWRDLTTNEANAAGFTLLEAGFNAIRIPAAISFWAVALYIRRSSLGGWFSSLEPYVFMAFCSHLLITTFVWGIWQQALGDYYGAAYPLFFFGMPLVVMASAVVGARVLNAQAPHLFRLLNGGRALAARQRARVVHVGRPVLGAKTA